MESSKLRSNQHKQDELNKTLVYIQEEMSNDRTDVKILYTPTTYYYFEI
jgi:hypothetical protein